MKLKENESPIKFLEEFENTVRQLKAADVKLEDQDLICNLLLSLPPSYETFVTVIENLSDVTYETVKSKLLAEDEKRRMGNGEENMMKTHTAFTSQRGCFRCGQIGHYKRDCPQNRGKEQGSGS